jgi:hypothetical protein
MKVNGPEVTRAIRDVREQLFDAAERVLPGGG